MVRMGKSAVMLHIVTVFVTPSVTRGEPRNDMILIDVKNDVGQPGPGFIGAGYLAGPGNGEWLA